MRRTLWTVGGALLATLIADSAGAAAGPWQTVRCGDLASFLINSKGDLYATGSRLFGNLGDRSKNPLQGPITQWKKVLTKVRDVSSTSTHSAALRANGSIWLTGDNTEGQLGRSRLSEFNSTWKKAKLPTRAKVVGISTGAFSSFAVTTDGALWVVGQSELGTETNTHGVITFSPKWQTSLTDTVRVQGTLNGAYVWRRDGSVWRIAYYLGATFVSGNIVDPNTPKPQWHPVTLVSDLVDARVDATPNLLTRSGDLYVYGDNENDGVPDDQQDANGNLVTPKPAADYAFGSSLAAFDSNTFGLFSLTTAGQLQYWVDPVQDFGPLVVIPGHWEPALDQVRSFCVGDKHALAIRTDGSVWGAGANDSGQFGNGTSTGTSGAEEWIPLLQ